MHLVNAGNSSFPEAWEGYQVLCGPREHTCAAASTA